MYLWRRGYLKQRNGLKTDNMRVAIVTSYNSKKPAGLERVLLEQLRALAKINGKDGVEYVVYTSRVSDLDKVLQKENFFLPVVKVGFGKLWKDVGLFFAPRAEAYFFNGPLVPLFFAPKNYFVLVYDFAYRFFSDNSLKQIIKNKWTDFISNLAFRRAKKIVAISNVTADEIRKFFKVDDNKLITIYLGWTALNQLSQEPVSGLPERYFLFIGTLKERKNVLSVVKAYAKFKEKQITDIGLVIVGKRNENSSYIQKMNAFIRENRLENSVFFTGHTTDNQVAYIYSHTEAMVFPSLLEGFGMPVLEAMSFGIPVITSNVSSLGEVAGNAAILVDPKSVEQIASAMIQIINNVELRGSLIAMGLARIQFFSWDRSALEYCDLFKNYSEV